MTLFISIAVILIGLAVLMMSFPLLRSKKRVFVSDPNSSLNILKDNLKQLEQELLDKQITQEQFNLQKSEIEARTVAEVIQIQQGALPSQHAGRTLSYALIIGVPLAVLGLYFILGNPSALFETKDPQAVQIELMVSQLEKKLADDPKNITGWMFLGRSYAAMNRLPEAKRAYLKAIQLEPSNDDLLADFADLVAFQNKSINAEAMGYIDQALKVNPKNVKALALRGSAFFDQQKFLQAISDWNLAIQYLGTSNPDFSQGLKESIAQANTQIKGNSKKSEKINPQNQLTGRVSIDPSLMSQVSPTDTVFIYAKASQGPKMPLAVIRLTANELPRNFELNDRQAMSPELALSQFKEFTVIARISKSANPIPQSGDLYGQIERVQLGANQINIVIKTKQP
jgi:cytochrome c-type biogenesis protein CcmH